MSVEPGLKGTDVGKLKYLKKKLILTFKLPTSDLIYHESGLNDYPRCVD
jgi:hypothetical protein